jgi:hypothetical protein
MVADEWSIIEMLDFNVYYTRPTRKFQELITTYLMDTKKARNNYLCFEYNDL